MKLRVRVHPQAKKQLIKRDPNNPLLLDVYLPQPALDDKANQALIKIIAKEFHKRKNQVWIISGEKSKQKEVQIDDS